MAFSAVALGKKVPVPLVVQMPVVVVPSTSPSSSMSRSLEQVVRSGPASTEGASSTVTVSWSLTARQLPLPVVVSVRVKLPEPSSKFEGWYWAFSVCASGRKVPRPPLQVPPEATVTAPFRSITGLLAHTCRSTPASTVGAGVKVMVTVSWSEKQVPLPVVVRYSVTLPEASSEAVGWYTGLKTFGAGVKVPLPPLHWPPLAFCTLPPSWTAALFMQTCWSGPASATGESVKTTVTWSLMGAHTAEPTEVRLKVTDPAAISAAVGWYCTTSEAVFGK